MFPVFNCNLRRGVSTGSLLRDGVGDIANASCKPVSETLVQTCQFSWLRHSYMYEVTHTPFPPKKNGFRTGCWFKVGSTWQPTFSSVASFSTLLFGG